MKTGSRSGRDLSIFLAAAVLGLAVLACSLPSRSNGQGQGTPPSTPPGSAAQGQDPPASTQPGGAAQSACLAGILPGTTTRDEVVALLGEPLAEESADGLATLLYASSSRGWFNSVVIQDQVVGLVSLLVGEDNPLAWSAVKAQYGAPAHTAYSNYLQGSMTYIYPDQGLSFIASQDSGCGFYSGMLCPHAVGRLPEYLGQGFARRRPVYPLVHEI